MRCAVKSYLKRACFAAI